MLFTRNAQDPIYNSLSDLKSNTLINEWFNLSVYDEAALSQTAQEIESIIKKIPESYFSNPPLSFKNFGSPHKQLIFSDIDDYAWFRQFFHSPRQLEKHYPLAILAFFDFSFLKYILEENPNVSLTRSLFKKSSDEKLSSYYSTLSKFKMLLLISLKNLPFNRFKNQEITPLQLLAVFYFVVTIAITHKIVDSYLTAADSSILESHANSFHKTLTENCKTCTYAKTCSHPDEWVSADVNASITVKKGEVFYGHKVHTLVDSVSNIVMGFFVSTASLHDNPLFIPLLTRN
ncbi:MAG: hypothetical protein NG747_12220 [Candidatus Brocadia sp.]|nr:hypothetical protein [Candidatus Brocadia sp.]